MTTHPVVRPSESDDVEADESLVRSVDGMLCGSLNDEQTAAFRRCVERKTAIRIFDGAAGFMGIGRVRFIGEALQS